MARNNPLVVAPVEQEERPTLALQEALTQLAGRVLDRDKQRLLKQALVSNSQKMMTCPRQTFAWLQRSEKDPEMTLIIE